MTLDNQYPRPAHHQSNVPYDHSSQSSMQPQQWSNIPQSQHASSSSVTEPTNITMNVVGQGGDPNFVPASFSSIPTTGGEINGTLGSSHHQQGDTITPEQPPPPLDPNKEYHAEWGVMRDQEFHQLALKHQRDLESHHSSGSPIPDFYFWQANLGGYCMADMHQNIVVSSEGVFVLARRMVEGAPHPGRKKKKHGMG